jgi:hypothetical protein
MLIRLIRNQPSGYALTGTLYVDSLLTEEGVHQYELSMDTLEHMEYAIPDGFYRLRMTYSPRFQEVLPILDNVVGRTGIRIHAGNTIAHTTGCILVGDLQCSEDGSDAASTSLVASSPDRLLSSRKRLEELRNYLLNYIKQNPNEEIYIQLESPDPYPYADLACSYEQQAHIAESLQRAQQLREERELSDEVIDKKLLS